MPTVNRQVFLANVSLISLSNHFHDLKEISFSYSFSQKKPQGQLTEAESMFTMMKAAGCSPDVITYTTMIHTYGAIGKYFLYFALVYML